MTWIRTCSRIAVVSALSLGALPFAGSAGADGARTDTKLAGFAVDVSASPLLVLLDDPKLEIPRPTGSAVVEGDPNYTLAQVSAGPTAHAISATLWPGNIFGSGLSAFDPRVPPYPLKAESRYPDKPYTADGKDGGVLTKSSAEGLDALATADGAPGDQQGVIAVGSAASSSAATVTTKDVAVGTAFSAVKDIDLVGGIVHIGSVTTQLETTADGTKPAGSGKTTVSGLTVGGVPFTVDDTGIHAAGNGGALPVLSSPETLAAAGITFSGIAQTSATTPNGIKRTAGGFVVTIETAPLKAALASPLSPVYDALTGIIGQLPPDYQGNFYYLLKATPKITYVFGAARSGSAATLPISFDFSGGFPDDFGGGLGGAPQVGGGALPGSAGSPGLGTTTTPPAVAGPSAPKPVVGSPVTPTGNAAPAGFTGIPGGWTAGAIGLSALVGWALMRFLGLAGGLLGLGCRLGAPTSVPDLRRVTA